jgi:nitroreductase
MDTWQAINSIRVVRKFAGRPLAPEHLERILNAGRRAASSKNEQLWTLVVVQDRDRLRDLAGVGPYAQHLVGAAAGIALVTPDPTRDRHGLSLSGTSVGRARTWFSPRGSSGSGVFLRPCSTMTSRTSCWDCRRASTASSSFHSAIPLTRQS